jgi:hypothetical protein
VTKFEELIEARNALNVKRDNARKDTEAGYNAEILAAWRKKFPRRKFTGAKSANDNAKEHAAITAKWQAQWNEIYKKYEADFADNEAAIKKVALVSNIPPSNGMSLLRVVSSSSYRSQGFGTHKYARAAAEDIADKVRSYGLKAEIREKLLSEGRDISGWPYKVIDYEVWAGTTETGVELLKNKPDKQTMAEWVRACDKRGVNCRVFSPFMTSEQEEAYRKA